MNNGRKNHKILKITILAVISVAAILLSFFLWINGCFLPQWIKWDKKTVADKTGKYEAVLNNKAVHLSYNGNSVWTSPKHIKIQDMLVFDADNDGDDELILLCWKIGRFGNAKPFWIDESETENDTWSQHLFIYDLKNDNVKPEWMSSYLGVEVNDIIKDEKNKENRILFVDRESSIIAWKWDSWGFKKDDTDVSFICFGDNIIHEQIYRYGFSHDKEFSFLFKNQKEIIKESDIAIINQETPLVSDPALYGGYPRFGTPYAVGEAIAEAGFDVVTCATNHALDRGKTGINTTKELFVKSGIKCLGIQTEDEKEYIPYEIISKNGIDFAMLNYTYGLNGAAMPDGCPYMVHLLNDKERIKADIKMAKDNSDIVIVFVHWGTENSTEIDDMQKEWTEVFLNAGVDALIGTHPHVVQKYETLKDKNGHKMLVFYSLGNFLSSQSENPASKGGMAGFTVKPVMGGYKIEDVSLTKLTIEKQKDGCFTVY